MYNNCSLLCTEQPMKAFIDSVRQYFDYRSRIYTTAVFSQKNRKYLHQFCLVMMI